MGEECGTNGAETHTWLWLVNLKETDHSKNLDVDEWMLELILRSLCGCAWTGLSKDS
jgi:hypothetical protein